MAGMRAVHKKNGTTFKFSGALKDAIDKAEKELNEKTESQQRVFLKWQRDNAVKAYENYEKRIKDLRDFIELGKKELKKRQEAAGHEEGKE